MQAWPQSWPKFYSQAMTCSGRIPATVSAAWNPSCFKRGRLQHSLMTARSTPMICGLGCLDTTGSFTLQSMSFDLLAICTAPRILRSCVRRCTQRVSVNRMTQRRSSTASFPFRRWVTGRYWVSTHWLALSHTGCWRAASALKGTQRGQWRHWRVPSNCPRPLATCGWRRPCCKTCSSVWKGPPIRDHCSAFRSGKMLPLPSSMSHK